MEEKTSKYIFNEINAFFLRAQRKSITSWYHLTLNLAYFLHYFPSACFSELYIFIMCIIGKCILFTRFGHSFSLWNSKWYAVVVEFSFRFQFSQPANCHTIPLFLQPFFSSLADMSPKWDACFSTKWQIIKSIDFYKIGLDVQNRPQSTILLLL